MDEDEVGALPVRKGKGGGRGVDETRESIVRTVEGGNWGVARRRLANVGGVEEEVVVVELTIGCVLLALHGTFSHAQYLLTCTHDYSLVLTLYTHGHCSQTRPIRHTFFARSLACTRHSLKRNPYTILVVTSASNSEIIEAKHLLAITTGRQRGAYRMRLGKSGRR